MHDDAFCDLRMKYDLRRILHGLAHDEVEIEPISGGIAKLAASQRKSRYKPRPWILER